MRWNREAFAALRLQGRVLADMSGAHTRLTLFEQPFDYPILLAPVAHQTLFHPEGELATARGASAMRAGHIVSMQASMPFEAIAQQSVVPPWCQVYALHDETLMAELLARVEAAGYRAIVVTADATVNGLRNREQRAGFMWPPEVRAVNLPGGGLPQPDAPAPPASPLFSGFLREAPTWATLQRVLARHAVAGAAQGRDVARRRQAGRGRGRGRPHRLEPWRPRARHAAGQPRRTAASRGRRSTTACRC